MSHDGILLSARCDIGENYKINNNEVIPTTNGNLPTKCHHIWRTPAEASNEFKVAWKPVLDSCLEGGFPRKGFCSIITQGAFPDQDTLVIKQNSEQSVSYLLSNGSVRIIESQFLSVYNDVCTDIMNVSSYKNHPTKVKVSVDDKNGCSFEGASKHIIKSEEQYKLLSDTVLECLPSNEKVRNRTHLITSLTLYDKDSTSSVPISRLFIIHLASYLYGSTSCRNKEHEKRHRRQLKIISKCLAGVAGGKDYRVLSFKDSKITRILQHPLHHMYGNNTHSVSVIQILTQDSDHKNDVTSQIAFMSAIGWKISTLDNISQCKDMLSILNESISDNETINKDSTASLQASEAACQLKQQEIEHMREKSIKNEEQLAKKRKQAEAQYRKERTEREDQYSNIMQQGIAASRKELQTAKDMVSGADGAVDESIRQLRRKHEEDRSDYLRKQNLNITAEREETDHLIFQISANERKVDRLLEWEKRVQNELKHLQEEHDALTDLLNTTDRSSSRTEGLTEKEIESKQEQFMLLDELFDLDQSAQRHRSDIRELKEETGIDVATDSESDEFESKQVFDDHLNDEYDTTPPASSSDSVSSSSSSSVISSISTLLSGSSSETKQKSILRSKMKKSAAILERRQFEFAIRREDNLKLLVENIMKYIEHGSYIIHIEDEAPYVTRQYAYLNFERSHLMICARPTERNRIVLSTSMDEVQQVVLGQHNSIYNTVKRAFGIPHTPEGEPPPSTPMTNSTRLQGAPDTLPDYYYRSLCIGLKGGRSLCFIADTDIDFEAWLVALHNRARVFPVYNVPLNVETHNSVSRLNEVEKRFCAENHITPRNYLNSKYDIVNGRRLLITLLDVRTASTLNLVHAQKLFQHLCEIGHIKQAILWAVSTSGDKKEDSKPAEENSLLNQTTAGAAPAVPTMKPSISDLQQLAKKV